MAIGSWARYREWNEAIAERLFSDASAGRAVYLAIEDEDLGAMCAELGEPENAGSAPLVSAVIATLNLELGRNDFRDHLEDLAARPQASLETPSSLALLAVLSLAADQMDAGDGMAAHNYYGRLNRLLGITDPDTQRRVQAGYQYSAEDLWAPLNEWLIAWDGARGVPTAYAVGQRYIGLPMSQALVRRRDRNVVHRIFAVEGLPPGYRMGTADMERLLDEWASRVPSPLSGPLRALWSVPSARERITAVAALELETWDGTELEGTHGGGTSTPVAARLVLSIRSFPRASVDLTLAIPNAGGQQEATLTADTTVGSVSLQAVSAPGGVLRLQDPDAVDSSSLLADELRLTDDRTGQCFVRTPRRTVVFRHDQLQNAYVETDRIQLGEHCALVVAASLVEQARRVLDAVARPGFRELPSATLGVPDGWVVIRDVHVLARYQGVIHVDLSVLLPFTGASLTLLGGFQLPGHLRKWSSLEPPEIQAVSESATHLRVRIDRGSKIGEPVLEEEFRASLALVPLHGRGLEDGEYLITLYADGSSRPIATSVLRLRSAATRTLDTEREVGSLAHSPSAQGASWVVSAAATPTNADLAPTHGAPMNGLGRDSLCGLVAAPGFRQAASAPDESGTRTTSPGPTPALLARREPPDARSGTQGGMPPARQRPHAEVTAPRGPRLRVGRRLGDGSCIRTGAHRFQLPTVRPGPPTSAFVDSECETCGFQKRFPTRARKKRDRATSKPAALNLAAVPPVASHATAEDSATAFDALCHLGGGSFSSMERVASQVDGSALFGDTFLRDLEVLGHVEVARSDGHRPSRWAMTPPVLVPLPGDVYWLVGWRSNAMLDALGAAAELWGGALQRGYDDGIPRVTLTGIARDLVPEVVAEVPFEGPHPTVSTVTPESLTHDLPPLSRITSMLTRVPIPAFASAERWDTDSASWRPTGWLDEEGAYRLRGLTTRYGLRSQRAVLEGTIAFAGVHLVKHIANAMAHDPLAGYHGATSSIVVPLGADLPGLYGRAVVLASGRLPNALPKHRLLQYAQVTKAVADTLADRLRR